jgi:hypothetical protein
MTTGAGEAGTREPPQLRILEGRAVDELVAKILNAAAAPGAAEAVARWRAAHPIELWTARGHDHVVIGDTLMYLHDAPDGTVIPHECNPAGRERVYTDQAHADRAYEVGPAR